IHQTPGRLLTSAWVSGRQGQSARLQQGGSLRRRRESALEEAMKAMTFFDGSSSADQITFFVDATGTGACL
ncbi:MAG: hypothetical protein ABJA87_09210, partial [bacterium]